MGSRRSRLDPSRRFPRARRNRHSSARCSTRSPPLRPRQLPHDLRARLFVATPDDRVFGAPPPAPSCWTSGAARVTSPAASRTGPTRGRRSTSRSACSPRPGPRGAPLVQADAAALPLRTALGRRRRERVRGAELRRLEGVHRELGRVVRPGEGSPCSRSANPPPVLAPRSCDLVRPCRADARSAFVRRRRLPVPSAFGCLPALFRRVRRLLEEAGFDESPDQLSERLHRPVRHRDPVASGAGR